MNNRWKLCDVVNPGTLYCFVQVATPRQPFLHPSRVLFNIHLISSPCSDIPGFPLLTPSTLCHLSGYLYAIMTTQAQTIISTNTGVAPEKLISLPSLSCSLSSLPQAKNMDSILLHPTTYTQRAAESEAKVSSCTLVPPNVVSHPAVEKGVVKNGIIIHPTNTSTIHSASMLPTVSKTLPSFKRPTYLSSHHMKQARQVLLRHCLS